MRVAFTPRAETEVDETRRWYNDQSPGLGDDFAFKLVEAVDWAASHPGACPVDVDAPLGSNLRSKLLERFPHRVVFEIVGEVLTVIAVPHNRRRPGYWKNREN